MTSGCIHAHEGFGSPWSSKIILRLRSRAKTAPHEKPVDFELPVQVSINSHSPRHSTHQAIQKLSYLYSSFSPLKHLPPGLRNLVGPVGSTSHVSTLNHRGNMMRQKGIR